ncbi:Putative DNA polymerase III, beta subunit [Candidatus Tremblaya princeps]|uniref:Putative DNA polymerase III, beta subunit n=2 Tax=Tremblaya princeps TaxID=189385 RepID=A0A1C3K8U3_TREPR|nr:Putative DNA polymerase III, beta subunit [Candidatus Tremblaya princeps]
MDSARAFLIAPGHSLNSLLQHVLGVRPRGSLDGTCTVCVSKRGAVVYFTTHGACMQVSMGIYGHTLTTIDPAVVQLRLLVEVVRSVSTKYLSLVARDGYITVFTGDACFHIRTSVPDVHCDLAPCSRLAHVASLAVMDLRAILLAACQPISWSDFGSEPPDVHLSISRGLALCASFDGSRMSCAAAPCRDGGGSNESAVVPVYTARSVARLLGHCGIARFYRLGGVLGIAFGQTEVACRLSDANSMDAGFVLARRYVYAFCLGRLRLESILRRATILMEDRIRDLSILVAPGLLLVRAANTVREKMEEVIVPAGLNYGMLGSELMFNADTLRDVLTDACPYLVSFYVGTDRLSVMLAGHSAPVSHRHVLPLVRTCFD